MIRECAWCYICFCSKGFKPLSPIDPVYSTFRAISIRIMRIFMFFWVKISIYIWHSKHSFNCVHLFNSRTTTSPPWVAYSVFIIIFNKVKITQYYRFKVHWCIIIENDVISNRINKFSSFTGNVRCIDTDNIQTLILNFNFNTYDTAVIIHLLVNKFEIIWFGKPYCYPTFTTYTDITCKKLTPQTF